MDNATTPHAMTALRAPSSPAFEGPRWNIALFITIAIVCAIVLFLTQSIALIVIVFREHPSLIGDPMAKYVLKDPKFVIQLLAAKNLFVVTGISDIALAVCTLGLARAAFGATPASFGLSRAPAPALYGFGILAGVALTLITNVVQHFVDALFGSHPQIATLALAKHHGFPDFALDFMSVAVFAPVAEEIFFRGFIFAGLAQRIPVFWAAIMSAALFSAAHVDQWSAASIFCVGLGLAAVYYYTKSLRINIIAHATFNTISLVIAYLFPQLIK